MAVPGIIFQDVSFAYDTASRPLFEGLKAHFPMGWTGVVGANGVGKTTLLRLATGGLAPQRGGVQIPGGAIYCPQRTDDVPPLFDELMRATDGDAYEIRGRLGIEDGWLERWETLSHGERKRAQVAVILWRRPQVMAVDEPTNHLDLPSIECLESALVDCPCGLLLVSHDRRFLKRLTGRQWRLSPEGERPDDFELREVFGGEQAHSD